MPHGAGNLGHYRAALLVAEALRRTGRRAAVCLHRDPKTVAMREQRHTAYPASEIWLSLNGAVLT